MILYATVFHHNDKYYYFLAFKYLNIKTDVVIFNGMKETIYIIFSLHHHIGLYDILWLMSGKTINRNGYLGGFSW